ncbi:MAG: DUF1272 domain-containing protein [Pseudomonadota bacterium]
MLIMHPDCQRCGADTPAAAPGAFICSHECTYCAACADALDDLCPSCGGELTDRPTRTGAQLAKYPASDVRRFEA